MTDIKNEFGAHIALRPVLPYDICEYIQTIVHWDEVRETYETEEKFSNVLLELPNATHNFFVRMLRAYIDNHDDNEGCYAEYLEWWELAFPDHNLAINNIPDYYDYDYNDNYYYNDHLHWNIDDDHH